MLILKCSSQQCQSIFDTLPTSSWSRDLGEYDHRMLSADITKTKFMNLWDLLKYSGIDANVEHFYWVIRRIIVLIYLLKITTRC